MTRSPPSRAEILISEMLGQPPPARGSAPDKPQPDYDLAPMWPRIIDGELFHVANMHEHPRSHAEVPLVKSVGIAPRLLNGKHRPAKVLFRRTRAPDWVKDLHHLVDQYEAGYLRFLPRGIVCNGTLCSLPGCRDTKLG